MIENVEHVDNDVRTVKPTDEEWRSLAEAIVKIIYTYAAMETLSAFVYALLYGCDPNIVYMDMRETSFTKMLLNRLSEYDETGDNSE